MHHRRVQYAVEKMVSNLKLHNKLIITKPGHTLLNISCVAISTTHLNTYTVTLPMEHACFTYILQHKYNKCVAKPGLCVAKPGLCVAKPGLCIAKPGLCIAKPGLCVAKPGLCVAKPGLCVANLNYV